MGWVDLEIHMCCGTTPPTRNHTGTHTTDTMSTLRRLAWAALIVTDAGAFLPAPSTPTRLERTCDRPRQPGCCSTSTCRVVQPAAAARSGGPLLCVEGQQRQLPRRHRLAGALSAVKKGRSLGGRKKQQQQQREEEDSGAEDDAAAMEAMRLEKLAEWRAMMQSGEVGTHCCNARLLRLFAWGRSKMPLFLDMYIRSYVSTMDLLYE